MRSLTTFSFIDEQGIERGKNIQEKAKYIIELITNNSYYQSERKEAMDIKQKVISTNISSIGNKNSSDSNAFVGGLGGIGGIGGGIGSNSTLKSYSTGINISANSFEQNTTQGVFSLKKDNDAIPQSGVNAGSTRMNNGGSLGGIGGGFDPKQPFKSANIQK